jgi:signal transduction histidine kinase
VVLDWLAEDGSGRRGDSWRPRGPSRVRFAVLAAAGLLASALAAALTAANVSSDWTALAAAARASMVALPIAVGLHAWHRRPEERFGLLLVAVGFGWCLTTFAESGNEVLYAIGRISGWVVEVGLVWLVLSFPSGRLTTRLDRGLVWAAAAIAAVLYLPTALVADAYPVPSPFTSCDAACPDNPFRVLGSEPPFVESLAVPLRELLSVLVFIAVTLRLVARVRGASNLLRRTLAPVMTVAIARLVLLALAVGARRATPESPVVDSLVWAIALAVPALAVAFFVGLLQRRLYVANALQRLGLKVRGTLTRDELRTALAEALEDPSLELLYRVNGRDSRWVDAGGNAAEVPGPESDRCLAEVRDHGRLVAGIVYDAALRDQPEFVASVASYAMIALENQRLAAKVASSLRELRESRARILASADRERRRIERDLHDGAQQRLVALRIQLELAEELVESDPERGREKLHALGEEVGATLDEIRALARGVYPSVLADHGLAEALRAAALRLPIAATVAPDGIGRCSQAVESAVYFCCLEAMQNAAKHAPDASSVTIAFGEDDTLWFEVRDDGPGFEEAGSLPGAGLTNMRDRLAAVGGELEVRSVPGRGTVVTGRVPLDDHPDGLDGPAGEPAATPLGARGWAPPR